MTYTPEQRDAMIAQVRDNPAVKRIEVIGGQTLILGDCLEVMPVLGRFDAVVTDPPYGIGLDKGFGGGGYSFGGKRNDNGVRRYEGSWDAKRPAPEVFEAILQASDLHVIWGGQFFADLLPPQGKWLFWDKCQTMPSFGDGELAWTSLKGDAVKRFTYNGSGLHAKEKNRVHPTQKPIAVMEWCLGFLPGATTILDPFAGSGSTLVACQKMGRLGTGIEIDPDYWTIACERVHKAWQEPDMFVQQPAPAATQEAMDL